MSASRQFTASILVALLVVLGLTAAGTASRAVPHVAADGARDAECSGDTHWSSELQRCVDDTHW